MRAAQIADSIFLAATDNHVLVLTSLCVCVCLYTRIPQMLNSLQICASWCVCSSSLAVPSSDVVAGSGIGVDATAKAEPCRGCFCQYIRDRCAMAACAAWQNTPALPVQRLPRPGRGLIFTAARARRDPHSHNCRQHHPWLNLRIILTVASFLVRILSRFLVSTCNYS